MPIWVVPRKSFVVITKAFVPCVIHGARAFFISKSERIFKIMLRTIYCGKIRQEHIDSNVTVSGWVNTKRDMGGVIFIDLKDREGTLQVVCNANNLSEDAMSTVDALKNQSVVQFIGTVQLRDEETINTKIETGKVELHAKQVKVLSQAEQLPFSLDESNVREDLRLKYRFLDIRRQELLNNLKFRHKVQKNAQDYLDSDGFICVETPMLTKSTPEGARDYLVPSRVHKGSFYALPQSPQIFKQLLMVGGIDKYYQVARCFRDEDLRADRQPEFTQVDMEMSFVEQEDVLVHLEKMFKYIFKNTMDIDFKEPFQRMTWHEAMDKYGSDKPDLRFDFPIVDLTEIAKNCDFTVFKSVAQSGGAVRAINVKNWADYNRSDVEELTEKAVSYGAKGMAWIAIRPDGEVYSILSKFLSKEDINAILEVTDAKPGDFLLFCADKLDIVRKTLGNLRIDLAEKFGLRKKDEFKMLIVTDFPQFEYSEEEDRFIAMHHPFTMPYAEDVQYLFSDPGRVRAQAYDFVLNGVELGSGSIRIYDKDVQQKMFLALGFTEEETEERFGFMVNSFKYGTPPHGGFAFGLDRLVMLMVGAQSLRDVVAFPKIKDASCVMTQAPSFVDAEQLEVLDLGFKQEETETQNSTKKEKLKEIDVENVANLARLSLTKEEKKTMEPEMRAIIEFANKLSEVDTEGVEITAHVVPIDNVFREDTTRENQSRDELLSNAPTKFEGYITVPKVLE